MEVFYECGDDQEFEGVKFLIRKPYIIIEFKSQDTICVVL